MGKDDKDIEPRRDNPKDDDTDEDQPKPKDSFDGACRDGEALPKQEETQQGPQELQEAHKPEASEEKNPAAAGQGRRPPVSIMLALEHEDDVPPFTFDLQPGVCEVVKIGRST